MTRYRAVRYDIPRGCAVGYMPELNVLSPIGDYSAQNDQPLMPSSLRVFVWLSLAMSPATGLSEPATGTSVFAPVRRLAG